MLKIKDLGLNMTFLELIPIELIFLMCGCILLIVCLRHKDLNISNYNQNMLQIKKVSVLQKVPFSIVKDE